MFFDESFPLFTDLWLLLGYIGSFLSLILLSFVLNRNLLSILLQANYNSTVSITMFIYKNYYCCKNTSFEIGV